MGIKNHCHRTYSTILKIWQIGKQFGKNFVKRDENQKNSYQFKNRSYVYAPVLVYIYIYIYHGQLLSADHCASLSTNPFLPFTSICKQLSASRHSTGSSRYTQREKRSVHSVRLSAPMRAKWCASRSLQSSSKHRRCWWAAIGASTFRNWEMKRVLV